MNVQQTAGLESLVLLFAMAAQDTGQARCVANFLLSWQKAEEDGGWAPTDLWNVDSPAADDLLTTLHLLRERRDCVEDLGFETQIKVIWQHWRGARASRE